MKFPITHCSGTQNSFLILDIRGHETDFPIEKRATWAHQLCTGELGVEVDGFVYLLGPKDDFDFVWDFYNRDGSSAEMCGNAARCVSRYFLEKNPDQSQCHFLTKSGAIRGERISQDLLRVEMTALESLPQERSLSSSRGEVSVQAVHSGVPHYVIELKGREELAALNLPELSRELRQDKQLGPSGANISYYIEIGPGELEAKTFERGVEDFTPACGTGAVAVAWSYAQRANISKISVKMPGGPLQVEFPTRDLPVRPWLIGPTEVHGVMTWTRSSS